MTIVIDPEFSVYQLIQRSRQASLLLNHRATMSLISHEIEKGVMESQVYGRLFVGFQRMSFFMPRRHYYEHIAEHAEVFVFGIPDTTVPSLTNITFVPLSTSDQLSKEWFIVFHGAGYYSALASEERTPTGSTERVFDALWTFDADIISILEEWLSSAVGAQPFEVDAYDHHHHTRIMDANIDHLLALIEADARHDTKTITQEINAMVRELN